MTAIAARRRLDGLEICMHDAGLPLSAQLPDLRSRCFCGAPIDASTMDRHVFAAHMAATIGG